MEIASCCFESAPDYVLRTLLALPGSVIQSWVILGPREFVTFRWDHIIIGPFMFQRLTLRDVAKSLTHLTPEAAYRSKPMPHGAHPAAAIFGSTGRSPGTRVPPIRLGAGSRNRSTSIEGWGLSNVEQCWAMLSNVVVEQAKFTYGHFISFSSIFFDLKANSIYSAIFSISGGCNCRFPALPGVLHFCHHWGADLWRPDLQRQPKAGRKRLCQWRVLEFEFQWFSLGSCDFASWQFRWNQWFLVNGSDFVLTDDRNAECLSASCILL